MVCATPNQKLTLLTPLKQFTWMVRATPNQKLTLLTPLQQLTWMVRATPNQKLALLTPLKQFTWMVCATPNQSSQVICLRGVRILSHLSSKLPGWCLLPLIKSWHFSHPSSSLPGWCVQPPCPCRSLGPLCPPAPPGTGLCKSCPVPLGAAWL